VNDSGSVTRRIRSFPSTDISSIHSFNTKEVPIMKSRYRFVLSLSLTAIGLFGLQGSAMALTQQNGSICRPHNYANGNNAVLYTTTQGIFNFDTAAHQVDCPVIRSTQAGTSGLHVWVAGQGSNYCVLSSYDFYGSFLGSTSFQSSGAQTFAHEFVLPQSQVPAYSTQALYCNLGSGGALFSIDPV
jgi:hypothetical protein